MTISNCNTCDHYSRQEPETKLAAAHCYMFRTAPEGICMQHSHSRAPKLSEIAMLFRESFNTEERIKE